MSKLFGGSRTIASESVNRFRAWFLMRVDKPQEVADQLVKAAGKPKDSPDFLLELLGEGSRIGDLVLVRADVVALLDESPCEINLIVPVDARSKDDLIKFKGYLQDFGSVIEARVEYHYPEASYLSNGYVSYEEGNLGAKVVKPDTMGLTRTSPGDNPWG